MEKIFNNAKWIWAEDNAKENDWVIFRKTFETERARPDATLRVGARLRYFLQVNDKDIIFDGGMLGESTPYNGYYDEIDISRYIVKGTNVITLTCWHYGGGDVSAGIIMEIPELNIVSDSDFKAYRQTAYKTGESRGENPPGHNLVFDAALEGKIEGYRGPVFESSLFSPAKEYGSYLDEPWNKLAPRPIPLYSFSGIQKYKRVNKSECVFEGKIYTLYTAELPRPMRVFPSLEFTANSGERAIVVSDRYNVKGGYGDLTAYESRRLEYICEGSRQNFEFGECLFGAKVLYYVPKSVKVNSISYRSSEFLTEDDGYLETDDELVNAVAEKARETLFSCMRETYISTPERGGYMAAAEAGVLANLGIYACGNDSGSLTRKTIRDITAFAEDGVLFSGVPASKNEQPAHNLLMLSAFGLPAYFDYAPDKALMQGFSAAAYNYLMLWDIEEDGRPVPRPGALFSALPNSDEKALIPALYLLALERTAQLAKASSEGGMVIELNDRKEKVRAYFENFKDKYGHTSTGMYDDSAVAAAYLAGEAGEQTASVLENIESASVLGESLVLEALGAMGHTDAMKKRIKARFINMAQDESPTLAEDFGLSFGGLCYGGAVSPLTMLYRYVAGVRFEDGKVTIVPDMQAFSHLKFEVQAGGRLTGSYKRNGENIDLVIDNGTDREVTLKIVPRLIGKPNADARELVLKRGKNKLSV